MLGKMAKDMPGLGNKEETEVGINADVGDSIAENGEEGEVKETGRVTDAQLLDLSTKLADNWKKLALKLGTDDDKLAEISEKDDSDSALLC